MSEHDELLVRLDSLSDNEVCRLAAAAIRSLQAQLEEAERMLDIQDTVIAERDDAERRLAEVEQDARRYRWLRDNRLTGEYRGVLFAQSMRWKPENLPPLEVDAAIDAAIKESTEQEKGK